MLNARIMGIRLAINQSGGGKCIYKGIFMMGSFKNKKQLTTLKANINRGLKKRRGGSESVTSYSGY